MRAALKAALATVDGLRVYELGTPVDPPGGVVGPPRLTWEVYCDEPTSAQFVVYLVSAMNERALDKLLELLPAVTLALMAVPNAVVVEATPGEYPAGDLPCYAINVDVVLSP